MTRTTVPKTRNPIWYFFENIIKTKHGEKSEPGDKFYRCRHGESKKPLRMTVAMRGSLTGLTGHLKARAPGMYRFWEILKYRTAPPTVEEVEIAEGQEIFVDSDWFKEFLQGYASVDGRQQTLHDSFGRAVEKALGPWDQAHLNACLLSGWLVTSHPKK
ncbi:hypothetical protein B0H14DRAFT_3492582 [Mycena olivaceomarginata]|nr:hypothetical protein B0H14DRAFT_3492582 [Mycena olivaceomarginata]